MRSVVRTVVEGTNRYANAASPVASRVFLGFNCVNCDTNVTNVTGYAMGTYTVGTAHTLRCSP